RTGRKQAFLCPQDDCSRLRPHRGLLAFHLSQNMITNLRDANESYFWCGGKITYLKEAREDGF
ncbi:MAG TPA: hypothetical protein PLB14_11820, partial [Smithellaceae bacterium]|nr:hypothetical protein [Smithellaceae bacterium]